MTRRQENQLDMYRAVLHHLDRVPEVWNGFRVLVEAVARLRAAVGRAEELWRLQLELRSEGFTKDKAARRREMCGRAVTLGRKMRPYARQAKDFTLLRAIDYSPHDLRQLTEFDVVNACAIVLARATERQDVLAGFGVTRAELDAASAAIEAFRDLPARAAVRRGSRAAATRGIAQALAAAREAVILLDDLVPSLVADAGFVETYRIARRIVNR